MADIQSAFVIVVGCGGVGTHAAHMLVRSGITRIRIIGMADFTLTLQILIKSHYLL
jgi:tRNA A37 threonylcarbamoyladenosine dehydratase